MYVSMYVVTTYVATDVQKYGCTNATPPPSNTHTCKGDFSGSCTLQYDKEITARVAPRQSERATMRMGHRSVKEPTSPRIVTNKQHSKHTWMRPIVLSIYSFINISITSLSPVHGLNPSRSPLFHESFLKNNI